MTHTTGLVIIPPEAVWAPIQAIRAEHDSKVRRWMPHITLIYPFLPASEFGRVASRLAPSCLALRPFELTLTAFDTFRHHRDNYTLWLRPDLEEPVREVYEALRASAWEGPAPRPTWQRFRPHLSVGQVRGRPALLNLLAELRRGWQPLRFAVDRVSLIHRGSPPDDVFRVATELPLGAAP